MNYNHIFFVASRNIGEVFPQARSNKLYYIIYYINMGYWLNLHISKCITLFLKKLKSKSLGDRSRENYKKFKYVFRVLFASLDQSPISILEIEHV